MKNLSKAARAIRQDNIKKKEDYEQGKRGKSVGGKTQKTEESTVEKAAEKQVATPPPKKTKKQEETQFVENKIKQEADLKAKITAEGKIHEQLGTTKQSQVVTKSQTAEQAVLKPKPVVVTTPRKEVRAPVAEKQAASPKVQFDETRSTLNKAATAEIIRKEPVHTENSQAQTGQDKVWDKINQDLASTTNFNDT